MKKIIAFVSVVLLALSASAQSFPSLLIPKDAATLGTAGIYTVRDAEHLYANGNFSIWAPDAADNMIGSLDLFIRAGENFAITLDGAYLQDKPYIVYNTSGAPKGEFAPSEILARIGGLFSIGEAFGVGVRAGFGSSKLTATTSGTAILADVYATYSAGMLDASLGVYNLGPEAKFDKASYALPSLVKASAAVKPVSGLKVSAEAQYLFNGGLMAGLGAEYFIADIVAIRAGYHYGDKQKAVPSFASVGLGLKYAGVELNAAYLLGSETLGGTMCFGLGYSF